MLPAAFRPATSTDADTIALHRYSDEADAHERPIYAVWVADALRRGVYVGFLAVDGEEVVAGAGLTLLEWGPSRGDPSPFRARVVNVWTHPGHRRRGLARELVTRCLGAAQERGVSRVGLGTSELARPLYGALGFRASGAEMEWRVATPGRG
ncbi:GNAT family N-acetyltransferase [Deinococcus aestuarii]|uniref:GNAT family N-acetyltransferase n=1 Tax=Deinococcus aestuarii TaxID=2774531 RepID=UPI001C0BBCD5|nr:GNAT family N-acetyltransferase [Deinococcus aestuarii]